MLWFMRICFPIRKCFTHYLIWKIFMDCTRLRKRTDTIQDLAAIVSSMIFLKNGIRLTIVLITHDLGVVANIADRVAVMYAGDIVEIGTSDEIYYDPRHPYTWALLSSMPQMGIKGEDLFNIQGTPPNLFTEIHGDAFAPRNPQALKIDFVKRPPYFTVGPTHKAKTWLLGARAPKG